MKKLAFIIGIISLAVACNAIEEPSNLVDDKAQEVKQVANAPVLSASIDESAEEQTKSYLNEADWRILWTANDEISAFVNTTSNWEYKFAGATGDQNGNFNPVNSPSGGSALTNVYAVYPYNASNSIDANGVMTVNFPAAQTYAPKTFGQGANTMVAVASTSVDNLSFKSACGYLMLKLYGTDVNVKTISLKGKNNEKIAGAGTVSISLGGDPTVSMASNATNEIVLTCANAVTIGNSSSNYTEFWFAIPPVTFTQGFTITVFAEDGRTFTKSTTNPFQIVRGRGKKMAPIQVVPVRTNLGATALGTANSYIVKTNGIDANGYFFPASMAGNGVAVDWAGIGFNDDENECYPHNTGSVASGGNDGVRISGDGVEIILNQNNCVSDVFYANNMIYFKASGAKGNAKLTLTNNGVRVWTWHIWCTDEPGTYVVNGYTVMDRNIGAITNGVEGEDSAEEMTGFYYPYGSPIGFTVAEYSNGVEGGQLITMKEYFQHPERPYLKDKDGLYMPFNPYAASSRYDVWGRIWGNGGKKTCYDPCPPGYKVTPHAFWSGGAPTAGANWDKGYYGVYFGSAFFPYNGRVYAGSYTNYQDITKPGIQCQDIYLSNAGKTYYDFTSRGRVYMWTSSSYNDNGWYYHVRKAETGGGTIADAGLNTDILTRGMGVRCIWQW